MGHNTNSMFVALMISVRHYSALSPVFLFALYIDDISNSVTFIQCYYIVIHADDTLLI